MKRIIICLIPAIALALLCAGPAYAYNNTSLQWKTIETEHFAVHFHEGAEWTAREIARIAEEVYPYITSLYRHEPGDKVNIVIKDSDDYANGAAYYYDNKIELWATNLEFGFRGTTRWLRNVFTHEFTHIISIQACMKFPQRMPGIYLQWVDFEDEKRSDVLTGYPNHIASYPIAGAAMAPWFAEGIAQYMAPSKQYDCWDAHRDMILRCGVLEDGMLTYDEMGFFGKNGMRGEQVYDHGYGLVRYIADKYGPEAINDITRSLSSVTRLTMDGALKNAVGKDGRALYDEWVADMLETYGAQSERIMQNHREGRVIADGGYMNIAPLYSPDGTRIVYLSNKGTDYGTTALYIMDADGENRKRLKGGVSSRAAFFPDGKSLVYSKIRQADRYGSKVNDLYIYNLDTKKEKQITRGLRASDAHVSPDGKRIICVVNADGTHSLALLDAAGNVKRVFSIGDKGTQLYSPQFSPDGRQILFGIFDEGTRDVAVMTLDTGKIDYLLRTENDERDVCWSRGGSAVVFSSERNGVFNVYEMDIATGEVTQLTNVIGGAFMPVLSDDGGTLVYTTYHANGYSVARIDDAATPVAQLDSGTYAVREAPTSPCAALRAGASEPRDPPASVEVASIGPLTGSLQAASFQEPGTMKAGEAAANETSPQVKTYERTFTPFQFYPRFIMYDRVPRVGVFMASNDILDKHAFFFGGSFGTDKEFDAYLSYELRELYPTLYTEVIRIREYDNDNVVDIVDDPFAGSGKLYYDLQYDAWMADIGLRLEFEELYSSHHRNVFSLFYTHAEYTVHYDADFYNQYGEFVPPHERAGWKYYLGNDITARYHYKNIPRRVDSSINPRGGREFTIQYMRAWDDLESGEFEYGLNPIFDKNHYNQYSLSWKEYIALPFWDHALELKLHGAVIDNRVNDFFWLYLGGRDGLRGYTYFSIGGRKNLMGGAMYRFPIWRRINKQLLHLYFRDLYGNVFFEAGNAWNEDELKTTGYEKSLGYEVRLSMGSFYTYPAALNVVAAYPLDEVLFNDPVFGVLPIVQKQKWRYYVTLGFEF
jgi:Tol biopolymer transport system component